MTAERLLDDDGRARADLGGNLARLAVHTTWRVAADGAIADLAAAGEPFTAEDVRARIGGPPGHTGAVGGAFRAASKQGLIVVCGYRPASRPDAHGRILRVWHGRRTTDLHHPDDGAAGAETGQAP